MRFWLILTLFLVAVQVISAFNDVEEQDMEVAETFKAKKFLSKYAKKGYKAAKKYAKKGLKTLLDAGIDLIKKEAIKRKGPFCHNTVCVMCLEFNLGFQRGFCAGLKYDNKAGELKLAIKFNKDGSDTYEYLLKRTINGLMKIPSCATLPYIGDLCLQGVDIQVEPGTETWKKISGAACVIVVARNISVGGKLCMEIVPKQKTKKGRKTVSFKLLAAEEREGTMYTTETGIEGSFTKWEKNKGSPAGKISDDIPEQHVLDD